MDIHWGNLLDMLPIFGRMIGINIAAIVIGVPIARLIERQAYPPEWNEPDWGLNLIAGWFFGLLIIGLLAFVLLMPPR